MSLSITLKMSHKTSIWWTLVYLDTGSLLANSSSGSSGSTDANHNLNITCVRFFRHQFLQLNTQLLVKMMTKQSMHENPLMSDFF